MKESAYKCSLRRMQVDTLAVSTCIPSISWRATFVPFGPFLHPCPDLYQTDVHRCSPSNLSLSCLHRRMAKNISLYMFKLVETNKRLAAGPAAGGGSTKF
ncbi:hypothetical protein GOODEAATRI_032247 [Goodea atripinnis]|uniref:Uncharacterized protein n=1 Tax=Goodea atripinnis TaxID=208336 RepID=A0ABV0N601_9TELE